MPKEGGALIPLASGQAGPIDVAVGNGAVYWINFGDKKVMQLVSP